MKKNLNYWVLFGVFCVAQVVFNAVVSLPEMIILSILPTLFALAPVKTETNLCLAIAFIVGFLIDFFTDGMLGLSSTCLLPVALIRKPILILISGQEILSNKRESPASYLDGGRLFLSLFIANSIFFGTYISIDAAGMFSFGQVFSGIFVSSLASTVTGHLVARFVISNKA